MRNQKGITLIALVITIIVLLILAGVTIAMLTGSNGILTNANKSNCENAYRQAEEQMKLAYMSVRTQIMAETVAKSTYNAATETEAEKLVQIVQKDLNDSATNTDSWTVETDNSSIYIRFANSAIDQGLIASSPVTPRYDTYVYGRIDLTPSNGQSAEFTFDIAQPTTVFPANS